jgi:branched-chain amino acid transport system substrate-binding protein
VKRRKLVVAAAAGAAVIALASSGIATADVPQQARGVSDDEVTVAGLGSGYPFKDFGGELGAQARFEAENEKGGVNGREINYVGWGDDTSDPSTNLAEARRLVQQEGVFALVPVLTQDFQAGDFLEQQKVPSFGWGISRPFCTTDYAFGITGCLVPPPPPKVAGDTWGVMIDKHLRDQGDADGTKGKTAAVQTEDNESGHSGLITIGASAEAAGMKVVYSDSSMTPEGGTPVGDYSPFVNDILTSDDGGPPDVVFQVLSQTNVFGMQAALNDAGYEGLSTNAVLYSPQAAAQMEGVFVFTQWATPEAAPDTPTVQTFVEQIEAVDPDAVINQPTIAGWLAADYFIKALKKAGKNPTPDSLQKAAAALTYQEKGLVGPTKYPKSFDIGAPCGQLSTSDGTSWSIVVPFDCYDNVNVKTLKKVPY